MPVGVVRSQGMLKPGNIELPRDSSPLRGLSSSESVSTSPEQEVFEILGPSRDHWSPARTSGVTAEAWAFEEAAERAEDEESSAWVTAYEGSEPDTTDRDIREPLKMPLRVVECCGLFRPQDIDPKLLTGISPPRTPVSESKFSIFQEKYFEFTSSSRAGWSPARVRTADAECRAFHEAAQHAALERKAAWAKENQGPEPGATKEDIRIYTKLGDGEYRYWGIRDLDETMEDFWARIDPDNTRERISDQDSGLFPARAKLILSKRRSPRPRTAFRSKRRQETPEGPKCRVTKPAMVTPANKKGIRKSLSGNIEGRNPHIVEQIQDIANSSTKEPTVVTNLIRTRWPAKAETSQNINGVNSTSILSAMKKAARERPRKIQSGGVDSFPSNPADWPTSMREEPPKRKRGRPAKEKCLAKPQDLHRSYGSNEKQKRPKAESKAKVTKPQPRNERPIAPSVHKMRTRARGSAENLQRF